MLLKYTFGACFGFQKPSIIHQMTHRFPIKEIALQSGLSTATVDRVLNVRSNVSPQTKSRVEAALNELELQEQQMSARGRRMFVDVVVEAPMRFSSEVKRAAEAILPSISTGVFRPRFIFQEVMSDNEIVDILKRILKRGSHGVCLKARDVPVIRDMVRKLKEASIPVVTLVSDLPNSERIAYVGLNNENAGRTAAFLIGSVLKNKAGAVLSTQSQAAFLGEAERKIAFQNTLQQICPQLNIVEVSGGAGIARNTAHEIFKVAGGLKKLLAVYSIGGGNKVISELLLELGHKAPLFVAHDLNSENLKLQNSGVIDFLLHHDLQTDMRNVFLAMAAHHRLIFDMPNNLVSNVQVVTSYNQPV